MIVKHSFVSSGFGQDIIIPLVKDKTGNFNNVDNVTYFEMLLFYSNVILQFCEHIALSLYSCVFFAFIPLHNFAELFEH